VAQELGASGCVGPPELYRTLDRVLLVDEDLGKKIPRDLRDRLRQSHSVLEFLPKGTKDTPLLRFVAETFKDAVIITGDNSMPWDHASDVKATNATLAIIAPCVGQDPHESEYECEVVQRWAHRMHTQATGAVLRYHLNGPTAWKPKGK
jgi:hypothetical protein